MSRGTFTLTSLRPLATVSILVFVLVGMSTSVRAQGASTGSDSAKRATVYWMQTYDDSGTQALSCVGSGTLISPTGLILTNAHLAENSGPCRGTHFIVALPTHETLPPIPTYVANLVQADPQLDLAVLQIIGGLDGSLISPEDLNLPFVEIGDSSGVFSGNTLAFVGYPDTGRSSVSSVSGRISGITAERFGSSQAWLRTDVPLPGVFSGGGAYDSNGFLVGVPTSAAPTDGQSPNPNCLLLQDTTGDRLISDQDSCVPIGGPISQIRPIANAMPLIEAAKQGFSLGRESAPPLLAALGQPTFSRLFFSIGLTDLGLPANIVTSAPSGTSDLYIFFDFQNMTPNLPYQLVVTLNGTEFPQLGLGPLSWGAMPNGIWFIGTQGVLWPDGTYDFTLLINGQPVASNSISVGGSPTEAIFSNLTFELPGASGGAPFANILLPSQTPQIDARFDFAQLTEGQDWTEVWYLDGAEISRTTRTWDQGEQGQSYVSAINYAGLPLGVYRLELFIGERLAATGDLTLAGNTGTGGQSAIFSNARIVAGVTRDNQPEGPGGNVLPLGTRELYAFVDWDLMPTGIPWTYRWYLDGRMVASSTQRWDSGGVGQNYWFSLASQTPLPEGEYAVEVLVEDYPLFSQKVTIGSGTKPVSGSQNQNTEVFIGGKIINALTGEGISGAMVFILDVAFESPDFLWNENQIYTQAISDENGNFSLPRGLPRGNFYTAYIMAEGYISIIEDNFTIRSDQASPVTVTAEMSKP